MSVNTPRILHIITGLATGGAERALCNLLYGGLSERFNNYVISLSDEGTVGQDIRSLGVPVSALGIRIGRPSLAGLLKLRRLVREFQPDLLQGWMYHGNLAASIANRFALGRPALVWNIRHSLYDLAHEKPMTRQVIRANRFFSSSPDILLYNSHVSRKQHENFGFASLNGRVISNGIDVKRFCASSEARKHVRSELGIPANALVVGHVARLHPMKDLPMFLEAAADLALRFPVAHFLLSGRNVASGNKMLEQLLPAELRNRFHLLGERGDVPELMCAMDVLASSSSYGEGFPNVLGEAMACGIPCVVTDVGDSALIVGDTGQVVPPRNSAAFAAALTELFNLSQQARIDLGQQARRRVNENFTLASIVKQYEDLYRDVIAK